MSVKKHTLRRIELKVINLIDTLPTPPRPYMNNGKKCFLIKNTKNVVYGSFVIIIAIATKVFVTLVTPNSSRNEIAIIP